MAGVWGPKPRLAELRFGRIGAARAQNPRSTVASRGLPGIGEEAADQVIAYTQKCVVIPLDTTIALLAAELHRQFKLATADAIVYATARHLGADVLTCDRHFEKLPNVLYLKQPRQ